MIGLRRPLGACILEASPELVLYVIHLFEEPFLDGHEDGIQADWNRRYDTDFEELR